MVIAGSGFVFHDAYAAAGVAPTFTAIHVNSTNTEVTFSAAVNGSKILHDWTVDGVVVTGITNGTAPHADESNGDNWALGTMNGTNWIMLTHQALDPDAEKL